MQHKECYKLEKKPREGEKRKRLDSKIPTSFLSTKKNFLSVLKMVESPGRSIREIKQALFDTLKGDYFTDTDALLYHEVVSAEESGDEAYLNRKYKRWPQSLHMHFPMFWLKWAMPRSSLTFSVIDMMHHPHILHKLRIYFPNCWKNAHQTASAVSLVNVSAK